MPEYGKTVISKWLSGILLLLVIAAGGYLSLQPGYNTAHWTPNRTMRSLGFSYESVLAYEHYLPWALHFLAGFLLLVLLAGSGLVPARKHPLAACLALVTIALIGAEWLQSIVGRNVQATDVATGLTGAAIGAFLVNAWRNRSANT